MKKLRLKFKNPLKVIREISQAGLTQGTDEVNLVIEVEDYSEENNDLSSNTEFSKLISSFSINLKDIREIILLAKSFWAARKQDPWCSDRVVFGYHLVHKDDDKDVVYTEDFINMALKALSVAKDPISDFYDRISKESPRNFDTFEEYYTKIYGA